MTDELITPGWLTLKGPMILSDGTSSVATPALEEAEKLGILLGGFTPFSDAGVQRFGLTKVHNLQSAIMRNTIAADGVVVLVQDPRGDLPGLFLEAAKARHKPIRLIIRGGALQLAASVMAEYDRLYVSGSSPTLTDGRLGVKQFLFAWVAERQRKGFLTKGVPQ